MCLAPATITSAVCREDLLSHLMVLTCLLSASQVPCSKDLLLSPLPQLGHGGLKGQHKNQVRVCAHTG